MTDPLLDEFIDKFAYTDLFSNELANRVAEEIITLRNKVTELEDEITQLKKVAYP